MNRLLKRLTFIAFVGLFATAIITSCTQKPAKTEATETKDSTEHPSDSTEHPAGEHPEGEHPADSTK